MKNNNLLMAGAAIFLLPKILGTGTNTTTTTPTTPAPGITNTPYTNPVVASPYQTGVTISPVDLPTPSNSYSKFSPGQFVIVDGIPGVITRFAQRNSMGEEYNVLMANNLGEFKNATYVTTYTNNIKAAG